MPSSSSSASQHRPVSHAVVFVVVLALLALGILALMRAVTPMKERLTGDMVRPSVSAPSSTMPVAPNEELVDGKTDTDEDTGILRSRPAGALCDARHAVCVTAPSVNATITNPVTIQGSAIVFEQVVSYELLDAVGTMLASGSVTTEAADAGEAGSFSVRVFWNQLPATATGTIVLFAPSPKTGQRTSVVRVPVRFAATTLATRLIYVVPEDLGSATTPSCDAVRRETVQIPATTLPVEATLRALLSVSADEVEQRYPGATSVIPAGTKIVSLKVTNGVANVVLSRELESYGGGSCNVAAIRAQIESTLKQFSSVRSVVISVEGKTPEESLQP